MIDRLDQGSSTAATPPSTAVVLVNYGGADDTIACIKSLLELPEPIGIFVVDNASPDASAATILAWADGELAALNAERIHAGLPPTAFRHVSADQLKTIGDGWPPENGSVGSITFIEAGRNGGFAAGTNIGLRLALADGYDFFWVLNNDTVVQVDTLHWLLAKMQADPTIGMCGSTLVYYDDPKTVQVRGGARYVWWKGYALGIGEGSALSDGVEEAAIEARMSFVNGASLLVSRACIEAVGLLEERYFLYWEEIDWAFRARGKFRLGYASRSIVRHKVGASIGTGKTEQQSPTADFYLIRSAWKFHARHSRRSIPFVVADLTRTLLRRAVRRDWAGATRVVNAVRGRHYPPDRSGVAE